VSPRQIVVLSGGEPWAPDLVRAVPDADEVSFPPGSPPEAWTAALARIEEADVVVVALSAATISDPAWCALAGHAVAWHTGLVIVVGDDTPLARWPTPLRDALPTTVDLADPAWPAELAHVVAELEPSRPQPWIAPPRPPLPGTPAETGTAWPAPRHEPGPHDGGPPARDAFDEARMDEDVQFTVYRPSAVLVDRWSWLLVFAHTSEGSAEEPDPLAEVRRQAEGVLGEQASAYGSLSADSAGPLRRGSTLLVEPWLDGATFNPPTVELRWEEPVHRADFRFRVGADAPAIARGGVRIFVGAVVVGELSLSVRVGERPEPRPLRTSAQRFRKVFASYSHADTEVVEAVATAVRLLGDEYLIDSHDLHSGEDWQQRIGELIDDADVFQLFWSSNALQSRNVLAECQHALALRREGFIRPVYWQDPLPADPDQDLPPAPIRRLHFSRLSAPASDRPAVPVPSPLPAAPVAATPAAPIPPPPPPAAAAASPPPAATAPVPPPPPPPLAEYAPAPSARPHGTEASPSSRRARRLATWGAVAAAAVVVVGVGGAALRTGDHDSGNSSAPATTRAVTATSTPTNVSPDTASTEPDTVPPTTAGGEPTTSLVTSGEAAFDRAVAYLGGLAVTEDPSCQLSAANPTLGEVGQLEEIGVDCSLTTGSGAPIQFRSVVLRPGVAVQQYLDGLAAAPALKVVGGSLPNEPDGPYLDLSGRLQDGRTYWCRAWGQAPVADDTNAVAIACGDTLADVADFWRLHR
jgi:TIR domain